MAFTIESLSELRPFVFHICSAINFKSIRATSTLKSASSLLLGTQYEYLLAGRRTETSRVEVGGNVFEVRDHRPLVLGSLELPDGYPLQSFISELNSRVFLWSGRGDGPVASGRNHIARYVEEGSVVVLRMPLAKVVQANLNREVQVTFCNSGAARHHSGKPARRSTSTFVSLPSSDRRASAVVEVTFKDSIKLPVGTEFSENNNGVWKALQQ
jgi:hypothetical protein